MFAVADRRRRSVAKSRVAGFADDVPVFARVPLPELKKILVVAVVER